MSSFVGHAAVGVSLCLARNRLDAPQVRWALPLLVLLAISPDLDYLALWIFHFQPHPRVTHSLLFCLGASLLAWVASEPARRRSPQTLTPLAVVLASTSHLALDLLVGVHPVPVWWPFTAVELSSPFGLLPSAGHLSLSNRYLWRNLLIECGVLWPVLALLVAWARGALAWRPAAAWKWLPVVAAWLAFLGWSLSLTR